MDLNCDKIINMNLNGISSNLGQGTARVSQNLGQAHAGLGNSRVAEQQVPGLQNLTSNLQGAKEIARG